MTLKKTAITFGIAFVALAGSAAASFAATAFATDNVNVRSGPGGSYGVVDNLRRGERVEIDRCAGSWCLVYNNSVDGWVSANYLGDRGRPVAVRPSRPVDVDINLGFGGGGYYGGHRDGGWGRHHDNWGGGHHRSGGGVGIFFGN